MSTPDYTKLVQGQRRYFKAGKTRPVSWRVEQLKAIKAMIEARRGAIREALWHDLRRNETDADLMDIDINIHEAEFAGNQEHSILTTSAIFQKSRHSFSQKNMRQRREAGTHTIPWRIQ